MREYRCQYGGRNYVLIDTPGFDDSYRSNSEIVDAILTWLERSYRAKDLLSGIIYLHRISDVRMQGSSLQNLRMFRKLCGDEALKNVLLVTTFWDTVNDAEGRVREKELSSNNDFWGLMISKGSRMKRWSTRSREHVTEGILTSVIPGNRRALQAQVEIVDQGRSKDEIKMAEFHQMLFEMNAQFEREKGRLQGQFARKQQDVHSRVKEEVDLMRAAAAKERQIKEDARFAAELLESERVEMENARARYQLQQQIARKEEETRQAKLKFQEESNRKEALRRYYENYQCTHAEAERWHTCDKCSKSLHKQRTHYYRKYCSSQPDLPPTDATDCCHCDTFGYNQCSDCGFTCLVAAHSRMICRPAVRDSNCTIM